MKEGVELCPLKFILLATEVQLLHADKTEPFPLRLSHVGSSVHQPSPALLLTNKQRYEKPQYSKFTLKLSLTFQFTAGRQQSPAGCRDPSHGRARRAPLGGSRELGCACSSPRAERNQRLSPKKIKEPLLLFISQPRLFL